MVQLVVTRKTDREQIRHTALPELLALHCGQQKRQRVVVAKRRPAQGIITVERMRKLLPEPQFPVVLVARCTTITQRPPVSLARQQGLPNLPEPSLLRLAGV